MRAPLGVRAGAALTGRSPGSDTCVELLHVAPPFVEYDSCAVFAFTDESLSAHTSTSSLLAPSPVGAPFARSTDGDADRSVRAPAYPSITHLPYTGSVKKHGSLIWRITCAFDQDFPPSVDVNITWKPCVGSPTMNGFSNISAKMYATPWLSVRTVQPERPKLFGPLPFVPAGVICFDVHVVPPSAETP